MRPIDPSARNERYKLVATVSSQLGTALTAAIVVKGYAQGRADWELFLWSFIAIALIWIAWLVLGLVEREVDGDGNPS